jgi:hypothetical protein
MKEKKISLTTAILLFVIFLLLLVIVCGAVYFVNKNGVNKVGKTGEKNEEKLSNKSVAELVTDAKFDYNTGIESFSYSIENIYTKKTETYVYEKDSTEIEGVDLKTSKFPQVNIDSTYARQVNTEIEKLFEKYMNEFKNRIKNLRTTESITDKNEKDQQRYIGYSLYVKNNVVTYSTYKNGDILSIVVKEGPFENVGDIYTTYNIDLNTGNQADFTNICNKLGVETTQIRNSLYKQMEEVIKKEFYDYPNDGDYTEEYNNYLEENKKLINEAVFDNTTKFFVDNNNKLNIIFTISHNAGKSKMECIFTVE